MDIMERLAQKLDEEMKPKEPEKVETPSFTQEMFENLMEKKMQDMELRLNATINKLIENSAKPAETPAENTKGEENHDSSTELPVT